MEDEFNPAADAVEVCEVLEPVTLTEFTVPMSLSPRPEVELLRHVADHLENNIDRVAVVAFTTHYITEPQPMFAGVLLTSAPIGHHGEVTPPGGPLDQK